MLGVVNYFPRFRLRLLCLILRWCLVQYFVVQKKSQISQVFLRHNYVVTNGCELDLLMKNWRFLQADVCGSLHALLSLSFVSYVSKPSFEILAVP